MNPGWLRMRCDMVVISFKSWSDPTIPVVRSNGGRGHGGPKEEPPLMRTPNQRLASGAVITKQGAYFLNALTYLTKALIWASDNLLA